jgi:CheY-like chemotaxis protein
MKTIPLVILFADRNPGPRRQLRVELRHRGAHVLLAGSTGEAIHQAAHDPPDILVADDDLGKDGQTDLATFIKDAFPRAGIILLRGSGQPTSSPWGLDLLLWTHKRVADQTLIKTIEFAFPGRLGRPTPSWARTPQIRCVDEKPTRHKPLVWFIPPLGYKASGSRVCSGNPPMNFEIPRTPVPVRRGDSTSTGLDPLGTSEVQEERGGL